MKTSNDMSDTLKRQEETYQQRLDKVLSKFEKVHNNNYNYDLNKLLSINYSNKEFSLVSYGERCSTYEFTDTSLDTVESLLKDMEVNK